MSISFKASYLRNLYPRDRRAFEQIYYQHIDMLYDYGVRLTGDITWVENCIQELFSDLWEGNERMNPIISVKSFLLALFRKKIIKKPDNILQYTLRPYPETCKSSPDFTPTTISTIAGKQKTYYADTFSKLSNNQKEVIYLRVHLQLSCAEIAEVMSEQQEGASLKPKKAFYSRKDFQV